MVATAINIVFIGPMGSGKSTIGRRVASTLAMDFIDCDQELERRLGVEVGLIFDIEGESGFRDRETRMLSELCSRKNLVIATGGGVVISPENCDIIGRRGFVIYLETPVDQQLERLCMDKKRPLLQTSDRREKLEALALLRNPLYEQLADLTIQSTNRSLTNMTRLVCKLIMERWTHASRAIGNENY
jgi:shikimate kinase